MAKVSLDKALKHIRTTLGLGNEEENAAALKIRAVNEVEEFEYLLTNIPQLDWAFSKNGGIPLGTIM